MDIRDLINKLDEINEGEFDQYSGDQATAAVANKQEFVAKQKQLYALLQKLRTLVNPVNESRSNLAKPLVESFGYKYNNEVLTEGFWSDLASKFNSRQFSRFRKAGFRLTIVYDAYRVYQKIKSLPADMPFEKKADEVSNLLYPLVRDQGLFFVGASLAALVMAPLSLSGVGAFISALLSLLAGGWAVMEFGDDVDKFSRWIVNQIFGDSTGEPDEEPATTAPSAEPATTAPSAEPTTASTDITSTATTPQPATGASSQGQGAKPTEEPKKTAAVSPEVKSVVDQIKGLIADLQQSPDPDAPKAVNHAKQTLQIYAPGL